MIVTVTKADLSWDLTKLIKETDPYQEGKATEVTAIETRQRGLGSQAGASNPAHRKTWAPECGLEAVPYLLSEEWRQ